MRLTDLLEGDGIEVTNPAQNKNPEITGLTCDSRQVEPGMLFAALPGARSDGHAFIPSAIAQGAAAVLAPPGAVADFDIPIITDNNPRRRYALMAARFYAGQPETVAAVTGTNGKTSTVGFLRQIWTHTGHMAASLGTLGVSAPNLEKPGKLTTPDPVDLHQTLEDLYRRGVTHLAMEASSHGLEQFRLDGVQVAAGAFTNLSRDHLDYHGTMEAYLASKLRLFTEIMAPGGAAVVNADSPECQAVHEAAAHRGLSTFTFGMKGGTVCLKALEPSAAGQRLTLTIAGRTDEIELPLLGRFQADNALTALTLAIALGEAPWTAARALEGLTGVPGRLEWAARHATGAPLVVDYAHTPDALAAALGALRPHAEGRLVVVFGCGGDRDPGKRSEMGRIAAELADAAIVTDDNPRSEDPAAIRRTILDACPGGREIGDRREAIHTAAADLDSGDVLLIAGKGHESGQIAGDEILPFDDREVAAEAVR